MSPRQQTMSVRNRKKSKAGKKRKADIRRDGTTKPAKVLFGD